MPIDFPEPIFDDAVLGGIVGSSHQLRHELLQVAQHLGIALDGECPTAASHAELVHPRPASSFTRTSRPGVHTLEITSMHPRVSSDFSFTIGRPDVTGARRS